MADGEEQGPARVKNLSAITGIDKVQLDEFREELERESDRGVILISVAILDDVFTTKLRQLLSDGSNRALSRLLDPPLGSLSGFMSKVDLTYCIGLINEPVYNDVRRLNKLRNHCAHNWQRFHITSEHVTEYLEPMVVKKVLNAANTWGALWNAKTPPREIMIKTLAGLITMVHIWRPLPRGPSTDDRRPSDKKPDGATSSEK